MPTDIENAAPIAETPQDLRTLERTAPADEPEKEAAPQRMGLTETAPAALRSPRPHLGAAGVVVPNEPAEHEEAPQK